MSNFNKRKVIFETERLFLREMTIDDVENLQKIFSDPVAMQYYPKTFDIEETQAWIQGVLNNYEKYGAGLWVCHLKSTGEFVGQCGLFFQPDIDGRSEIEIGYFFVREFWHQGLATEAIHGVIKYTREKLGYQKLISLIRPENIPSRRMAGRNGLVPEKEIMYKGYKHLVYVSDPNVSNLLDLAQNIVDRLEKIDGIVAVALGGSLARGEGYPDSDIDFGLYYNPNYPPSIPSLNLLASKLDDSHASNLVTEFGEWGLWVNGGGWLNINKQPVDWLYRDISHISKVIEERIDVFYVTGCLFRCIACLTQVLFALNERYFINEKGSILVADSFAIRPRIFKETVDDVMSNPGRNSGELIESINKCRLLIEEVKQL